MPVFEIYILLFILIFFINVIPAFMPPTWIVLSYLYLQYNLSFTITVIIGVIAATAGRGVLSLLTRNYFKKILPEKFVNNYKNIGMYLKHKKITIPLIIGYAFSPISSNTLFIMAGLSNMDIKIIMLSFFIGRIFSYSFWITASYYLDQGLQDIFANSLLSYNSLISALVSIVIVTIIGMIRWGDYIPIKKFTDK